MEKIIVLGDLFVRRTAKAQFLRLKDAYSKRFDIEIAAGDIFSEVDQITCRISNAYIDKLNNCVNIPKMVFIVIENDIINDVELKSFGVTEFYGRYIEEIINECNKITLEFANILPFQSKRDGWPRFVWIVPTQHNNYSPLQKELRMKFAEVLENIAQHHRNVWTLKLRQVWDENNNSLFSHSNNKFTNEGLHTFWTAFDRTVKYCDKKINRQEAGLELFNTGTTATSSFGDVCKSQPSNKEFKNTGGVINNRHQGYGATQGNKSTGYYERTFGRHHNLPRKQLTYD